MKQYLLLSIFFVLTVSIFGYYDEIEEAPELTPEPEPLEPPEIIIDKYHLFTTRVNWTEAVRQCRLRNMELISILSKEQNDKILKTIRDAYQGRVGFWTSGTRRKTNDTFFWGNGKAVSFADWENGRPDNVIQNGEEEECIEIKGFYILKWNDNFCNYGLYYICEEAQKSD